MALVVSYVVAAPVFADADRDTYLLDASRMDELQAAFLSAKLRHLNRWKEEGRKIVRQYGESICGDKARCPPISEDERKYVFRNLSRLGAGSGAVS